MSGDGDTKGNRRGREGGRKRESESDTFAASTPKNSTDAGTEARKGEN